MVTLKQFVATAILCSVAVSAPAKGDCTSGSEFEPALCPLRLPRIGQIIVRQGRDVLSEAGPAANCAAFRPTPQQVRRYMTHAKAVGDTDAHHILDRSPCFAAGELVFNDGRRAEWYIEEFRAGTLKIGDGDTELVYCQACRFRPFRW